METAEIPALMRDIAIVMREYVTQQLAPLAQRLETLEANAQVEKLTKPKIRIAARRKEQP